MSHLPASISHETSARDLIATRDALGKGRAVKNRLLSFCNWHESQGGPWYEPDLPAYRDHLLARGFNPSTVSAHLSTIRAAYRALLTDNATRRALFSMIPADTTGSDRKAVVDELLTRLENDTNPARSSVKVKRVQDRADSEFIRLTPEQADRLLAAPDRNTLPGLRDAALLALMLATGIREAEACALTVDDLRQTYEGAPALRVSEGKGCKQRMIPYGEMIDALAVVDTWLAASGIGGGAVFRSFWRGNKKTRGALSVRAVEAVLGDYPIMVGDHLRTVKPHDLRRSYARLLYDAGVKVEAIQKNLGHDSPKTTIGYIGDLSAKDRQPPRILNFKLNGLPRRLL